jgi:hypothetical protein
VRRRSGRRQVWPSYRHLVGSDYKPYSRQDLGRLPSPPNGTRELGQEQFQGRFSEPRNKQNTIASSNNAGNLQIYSSGGGPHVDPPRNGHKRSNTISELYGKLFGKRGSIFETKGFSYDLTKRTGFSRPPVSMTKPISDEDSEPRRSIDSRRMSFGFGRNISSEELDNSISHQSSRRFFFIPASLANTFEILWNTQYL